MSGGARPVVEAIFDRAGLRIDGDRPRDPRVHDSRFFGRIVREGSLGLGESYMDGWWDAERLDAFFAHLLAIDPAREVRNSWRIFLRRPRFLLDRVLNPQRPSRAHAVGAAHYDIGDDLFEAMLDPRMIYTCAYWRDADTLERAQEAHLDLTCRKLGLEEGMSLLDIGCGWGGLARFAAERYGVNVLGITVSENQERTARERCAGLPVEIRRMDYREIEGRFDRVVSLGMFEHVGRRNYGTYFDVVRSTLPPHGLFLLETIGGSRSGARMDAWFETYIFPRSVLPSAAEIAEAVEDRFVIEDWHAFGADYDLTLMAWHANAEAAWDALDPGYDERFRRMWRYYLLASAGAFRCRKNRNWQVLLSPKGVPGGHRSLR